MIVALQYYEGDRERALSLARLLADLEPCPRSDVLLALICQPNTSLSELTCQTMRHCDKKFPTTHVVSARGAHGHPEGCGQLWAGAMDHFACQLETGDTTHNSILTLDGNDGVPLHRNWINLLKTEHDRTLSLGKLITGTPYNLNGCPLHVNPNMTLHLSIWKKEPLLHNIPRYDGTLLTNFDIYHRHITLKHASLSSIIWTDWRGGGNKISPDLMRMKAEKSIWLHGYKDDNLYSVAAEHLLSSKPPVPLVLERYQLNQLRMVESVRAWSCSRQRK